MFGVLISGRFVQTNAIQVSENKFVFSLENAADVSHVAVFLTGAMPLPNGTGAVIYIGWPPFNSWKYLGYITNQLPSGLWEVVQSKLENQVPQNQINFGIFHQQQQNVQIGIEIGELKAIEHQFGTGNTKKQQEVSDHIAFCQSMLQSMFDYVASFGQEVRDNFGRTERFVPLSVLERWYGNFETKLKNNPNFWRK